MADNETEEEPSIEEILDSIRQIISDDDEEPGAEESVAEEAAPIEEPEETSEPEPEPEPEEEVIELTDKIDEPETEPEPEAEPEPEPEPEPEEEITPDDVEDVMVDMRDSDPEDEPDFGVPAVDEGEILTGVTESAAMQGFDKLVKQTKVEFAGITLEEIVRTELKPLLKEWLDDNLPSMIERLVEEELRRVSKTVLGDD